MTGLCGWVGALEAEQSAKASLETMAGGLIRFGPASMQCLFSHVAPGGALHVEGRDGAASLALAEELWAAIEGAPRWTDEALARIARERGHGEALAEAYRRHGESLLDHLMGGFSLAVIDRANDRALLAIDRWGIGTLCYAPDLGDGLVFGSTTDAVRKHPTVGGTVLPQQVFSYLYFMVVPSPHTIYAEQRKLLPAQMLVYEGGRISSRFYWEIPYEERRDRAFPDLAEELMALLRQAVSRSVEGSESSALGAFLSGGLDSSTIVGLLGGAGADPVRSFTIGFEADGFDEMAYANIVAEHFGTEHHQYYLKPADVTEFLPRMAAAYDEPFGNSSAVPAYFCARMARDTGVTRMLGGDGGDEIFAGNTRYAGQLVYNAYDRLPRILRAGLIEPVVLGLPALRAIPPFRKARNYVTRAKVPLPDRLVVLNPFEHATLSGVLDGEVLAELNRDQPLEGLREAYGRASSSEPLKRMMHLDMKITLADNDLRKVARMCEMADVPVRFPFLDEDLVAFSARLPSDMLVRGHRLRDFFKRAVRGFLPEAVIAKKKHGFGMPFSDWPREDPDLKALARDCLEGLKRRGYLAPRFIDRALAPRGGNSGGEFGEMIWDLMVLELWFRAHR